MNRGTAATPWIERRAAGAALGLAALVAVLAALASVYPTFPLDHAAIGAAQRLGSSFAPVATVFNEYDWTLGSLLGGVLAGLLAVRRLFDALLAMPLAVALTQHVMLLKELVGRARPGGDLPVVPLPSSMAFPSGHTATAAVFFGLWFVFAPEVLPRRWVLPARAVAVLGIGVMATSRMWAGVHWLSDTYGGALCAAAAIALVLALRPTLDRVPRRWRRTRAGTPEVP